MITEPLLLERLAMDDAAFERFIARTLASVPPRAFTPEVLARALGYPWERPAASFLLEGERVRLLGGMGEAERAEVLEARGAGGRVPLLAIGSNGAPARLALKLAHLPEAERRILVLAGELRGVDIGAAAHPTAYGSMPATPFASPGTAVRAAVLWVSAAQLTQLSWTEITYRLGRLDGAPFRADEGVAVDGVLLYVSRRGTFSPGGAPLALAAIPARGRTAPARTQRELLDLAAPLLGHPDHAALVRAIFTDLGGLESAAIRATGVPFAPAAWTPWRP